MSGDALAGDGRRSVVYELPTAAFQRPPSGTAPRPLVARVVALERDGRLDRPATALDRLSGRFLCSPAVVEGLRGSWTGHALHPLLTDFPLGAWMAASFLDLFGGSGTNRASQRLVGFGLLAATPTAAAGLAEWKATTGAPRRVGVVHAGVNSTAALLYACSWLARRKGAHRAGVVFGIGGGMVAFVGGYLGGHLSLVRKIGTADSTFGRAEDSEPGLGSDGTDGRPPPRCPQPGSQL